jgi:glycosyltransferase involved in cell wall biosynthesis
MFASSRHASPDSPKRMKSFSDMVTRSDTVIAGNSYLKSLTEPYNKNVHILPTTIELTKYQIKSYEPKVTPDTLITLGWLGGAKSLVFLKILLPLLEDLTSRFKNIQLKIICNEFFKSNILPIIEQPWTESNEANDILSFDIGLAPLPDDPWSRGKCATKLLQYMAAGIPSIASTVGIHNDIIQDGANGFLVKYDEEWIDKLIQLIENPTLRQKMGLAGRKTVDDYYSVAVNAPKLLEILRTTTSTK